MSALLQKWHFNVDQYYRLAEVGVLKPDDRVELIEGEIVRMRPIGSSHAACVRALDVAFNEILGRRYLVSIQSPVRLDNFSEPEPDLALLKPRKNFYADRHPMSSDVFLIIEVADTTVLSDQNVKLPLYARFGIAEAWLVNLPEKVVEIYYDPADGRYRNCLKFKPGDTLKSPTINELTLKVDDIIA
jgi:Uma2 family endonuclease